MTAPTRATDPAPSHAAAATVDVKGGQALVLALLRDSGPFTDEQMVWYLNTRISPSGVRTRRKELERAGLVTAAGEGKTASGRRATLWQAA